MIEATPESIAWDRPRRVERAIVLTKPNVRGTVQTPPPPLPGALRATLADVHRLPTTDCRPSD